MTGLRTITFILSIFAAAAAHAAERTIIVLDGSGSMWGQINGTSKIEIARETLGEVLASVPGDMELGLMVYGHREKGSCSDIELAVAPAAGTGPAIAAFANGLNPKGKTPISASVRMAAEQLRYQEDKATVILVTDGLETCEADPCALANELEAGGVDFTAHVVGFGLTDEEGRQVACLADNTGGRYFRADDAGQLAEALTTAVVEAPAPDPEPAPQPQEPAELKFNVKASATLSQGGEALESNRNVRWDFFPVGEDGTVSGKSMAGGYGGVYSAKVPAGRYVAAARLGKVRAEVPFEASGTELSEVTATLNAGIVRMIPKRTEEDAEADGKARVDALFAGVEDGGYGETTVYASAGEVVLRARIERNTVEETITLAAGETVEKVLVVASGIVVPHAVYAEGGPSVDDAPVSFTVVEAKADISGTRKPVGHKYRSGGGINAPAGDYVLTAKLGSATGEAPVTVKAGERTEVTVNINGGVLHVAAPGAHSITILDAKKDIQGNQKRVDGGYGETFQSTFAAGAYEVVVAYKGDRSEARQKAEVKAGERTEIQVD